MVSPLRAITAGFLIVMVSVAGVTLLDSFAQSTGIDGGERVQNQGALFDGSGEFVQLANTEGKNEQVYKTTGNAVNLTGASDSYVRSAGDVNISTDDSWTISVWAYVDAASSSATMAAVDLEGRAIIYYNGTAGQWSGWYYDDGDKASQRVNVSTNGSAVGSLTNIQLRHNGTHLEIYRNGTLGETAATTGSTIEPAPVESNNWDGRLEELRTFDKALNTTERDSLVNQPVEQLPDSSPTTRAMFDQPGRTTQLLLYAPANLDTSNVTYSAGFAAQQMDRDSLLGGDYKWSNDGPQIAVVDGGELDGAPVAYVNYDRSASGAGEMIQSYTTFTELMSLVPVILGFVALVTMLSLLRQ